MPKLNLKKTGLEGCFTAESEFFKDHRGAFARFFCNQELSEIIKERKIVQINHSITKLKGAVRGMHFQCPPHAEMKLIRCLRGRVFDVALDLRKNSESFLKYHCEELSPENGKMIIIPEGFAHGFQVLEEDSELLYLHTAFYHPDSEGGVRFDDPAISIAWPLQTGDISERDKKHPLIDENFKGIEL